MHPDHDIFVQAVNEKRKVELVFFRDENDLFQVRLCAPIYYGLSRIAGDELGLYHFWDLEHGSGKDPLALPSEQIVSISKTKEAFDPEEFVRWDAAD